jgi:undecaprenyl-diphosphatase
MLITILEAIILGIVQGATEFIPVSSSAHLIIVPWLAGWNDPALTSLSFDVSLHLGTLVAVLIYFAQDWVRLFRAGIASIVERRIGSDPDRRMAWFVVIGTIPGAIFGALGESKIDALFHQPNQPIQTWALLVMAAIIAGLGLLLWLADRLARHEEGMQGLTLRQVLLIGLAQALAIFPGVSRSGATITAGLGLGLKRETAAKFSFLLSAPLIAGVGLKSLYDTYQEAQAGALAGSDLILFPIGFLAAGVMGYLCIRFLMSYLQNHTAKVFAIYRFGLAALVAVVALLR